MRIATLHHADREEKLHRARAVGRVAYRIARAANLVGVMEIEGDEKHLRKFRNGLLFIDLYEPFRLPVDAEFSRLRISYNGKNVFEIRWESVGTFNIIPFEEAIDWIGSLARATDTTEVLTAGRAEPSTWAMSIVGFAGLRFMARRRRKFAPLWRVTANSRSNIGGGPL
jgi:hypothetical protein